MRVIVVVLLWAGLNLAGLCRVRGAVGEAARVFDPSDYEEVAGIVS